ncbi:DUF4258 domain-containing protein [Sphingobacteriales bacterium UPWRP_1]|nr:hypothetical protein BVG80_09495 [Sphingobacteriales bacterium TSM_CSM]PSJ78584.1 DUF4258 domain-containing protein [Sphingobacteriales bacterium UPWRP_1]
MKLKKFTKFKISKRLMTLLRKPIVRMAAEAMQLQPEPCFCPDDDVPTTPDNAAQLQNPEGLTITPHARKRAAGRGITLDMIENTIKYGAKICKQGFCFYVMPSKIAQRFFSKQFAEKIANTVVLVKRPNVLITVYKNQHALRNIKKKSKRLHKYQDNNFPI